MNRTTMFMNPQTAAQAIKNVTPSYNIDSFNFEKNSKMSILQNMFRGITAKGSGLRENSGEFIVKLAEDQKTLIRVNIRTKKV
jgi:hypothetical protein